MAVSDTLREATRIAVMRASGLLETPPEETFDRLTALATRLLDVPLSTVTLIDADRQFFVSCVGVDEPWKTQRGTPLSHSFCQYVVSSGEALIVEDARDHPLVGENLAIRDLGVIAYAGMPLVTSAGVVLGSFCAIDHAPRHWSESDLDALRTLADAAVAEVELRVASRELSQRESRFRGILENVRALAVTIDVSGRITFVNDYLVDLLGWKREELLGADWFETLVPPDEAAMRRAKFAESHDADFASHNQGEVMTRSGSRLLISWDNIQLRDSNGDVIAIAAIGHDVTAQAQAARLKDELIGLVSHELRGPLTAMRGGLKLMSPHVASLDEKSRKLFDIAVRNGDRLLRLVNDLLDLERIESGTIPMAQQCIAAKQIVEDARESMSVVAESAGVTLETESDDAALQGDGDRLVQVLTNLVGNAIKFSPSGATVTLRAHRVADGVEFTVADRGRGIPADQLERIFERFAQVEGDDSKKKGGAGLGLSISRAIVEQHGGRVWAEARAGGGSEFHVIVPAFVRA